jgi:phospholipid transport system substrate-binding protein
MWLFKRLVRDISTPRQAVPRVARAAMLCLALGLALGLSPGPAPAAAQEDGPSAVIERLHGTLLEVMMAAKELGYDGRYERLAPVLEESYDFPFMTRIATATAWRDMADEQQAQLIALFKEMSIANYAARFNGYGGEAFETLGEAPGPRDAVVVESRLVRPEDAPVQLNYVMREQEGAWRIVDVLLDAKFSELARQQAEFSAVLRQGGVADLEALLEQKIATLEAEGGS